VIAHRRGYHEWPNSTPLLDITRVLVGAASLMIGAFAVIFAAFAARDGNGDQIAKYVLFLVGIAVANGLVELAIRWRRHHG
jgi:heme/copper-type cytochrome/quinol oxidase subunit 3